MNATTVAVDPISLLLRGRSPYTGLDVRCIALEPADAKRRLKATDRTHLSQRDFGGHPNNPVIFDLQPSMPPSLSLARERLRQ